MAQLVQQTRLDLRQRRIVGAVLPFNRVGLQASLMPGSASVNPCNRPIQSSPAGKGNGRSAFLDACFVVAWPHDK
jgi:hypothetical protein